MSSVTEHRIIVERMKAIAEAAYAAYSKRTDDLNRDRYVAAVTAWKTAEMVWLMDMSK
jgi:hypothetical protein